MLQEKPIARKRVWRQSCIYQIGLPFSRVELQSLQAWVHNVRKDLKYGVLDVFGLSGVRAYT